MLSRVSRAVHRKNVVLRKKEIHDPEDRLLHLAGILRPADEDDLSREVNDDEGFRAGAVAFWIGFKFRSGNNGELRLMCFEFFVRGTHK